MRAWAWDISEYQSLGKRSQEVREEGIQVGGHSHQKVRDHHRALIIIPMFVDLQSYRPENEKRVAGAAGRRSPGVTGHAAAYLSELLIQKGYEVHGIPAALRP